MIQQGDLESDLCAYCNLKCSHCAHSSSFFTSSSEKYPIDQFERDINILSKKIHCEVFRVVGGEPLLNRQLSEYLKILKSSNIADNICVFTNGLLLTTVPDSVFTYIDQLRVSVYDLPAVKLQVISEGVKRAKTFQHLDVVSTVIPYFSKFNLIQENKNTEQVKQIYENCYHKKNSVSLFNSRLYRCFITKSKLVHLQAHDKIITDNYDVFLNPDLDSIKFTENTSEYTLRSFLDQTTPLETCKWCLGCSSKRVKVTQLEPNQLDYALLSDYDPSAGKSYLSNCLFSWFRDNPEYATTETFFHEKHLNDFSTYHTLSGIHI